MHRPTDPIDGLSFYRWTVDGVCRSLGCLLNFIIHYAIDGPSRRGFVGPFCQWPDPTRPLILKDITVYIHSLLQILLKFLPKNVLILYLFPLSPNLILPYSILLPNQNPSNLQTLSCQILFSLYCSSVSDKVQARRLILGTSQVHTITPLLQKGTSICLTNFEFSFIDEFRNMKVGVDLGTIISENPF